MNDATPCKAAVIGFPVTHSRSPLIHNYWLAQAGIAARYAAIAVPPGELESFLRGLAANNMRGCNITVPHKEAALTAMDVLDPLAKQAGAVNTVVVAPDGALHGFNTDIYGFSTNLSSAGKAWKKKRPALVVGAGGAARAVLVALSQAGCKEVRLVNRTLDRARDLRDEMQPRLKTPLKMVAWQDREDALENIGLLVNTTTQGMDGQEALDLDLRKLDDEAVVTDLVYTPLITPLLAEAKKRGHKTVDGLGMLLHQAVPGFAGWFGVTPQVTAELRGLVEADLGVNL